MQEIGNLIATIGFPIVSFLMSAYFIKYSYDKTMDKIHENDEREERHWNELSKLTQAVSENSTAIRELIQEVRGENK